MNNEFTIIVDEDRKYTLMKRLTLGEVLEQGPCDEAIVDFIKAFPKDILLAEIDPGDITGYNVNDFKRLMKLLAEDYKWNDVLDFLEDCGFIKCEDLTDEEWHRYWRNKRRRELRAKAKKQNKKK